MRCSCIDLARRLAILLIGAFSTVPALALDADRALTDSAAAVGRTIGDYAFTDARGRRVALSDYRGKPLVVSFVYTGCGQVCPTATRYLAKAVADGQAAVGRDAFNVVTIGFNQPFDNPAAMSAFARQQGISLPQWHFLSPDAGEVAALTRDFGFDFAASPGGFDHVTQVTLVDAGGRIRRQVYGEAFASSLLVEPLKAMVAGASVQDWPALLDRVRVLCTVYDPRTGRYRLDYGLFIELFAGITFLAATAWFLGSEWRRQRRVAAAGTRA